MNTRTSTTLARCALIATFVFMGWVGYDSYYRIIELSESDQQIQFNDEVSIAQVEETGSMDKVIEAHLFGVQPVVVKKKEKPKVINAPKTRLNLNLSGLVASNHSQAGYAMVEVKRGETSIVKVGKAIGKTGAKLHAIHSDYILIDHRGKIEKLQLERKLLSSTEPNSIDSGTIKQLNLSESELATLTQIGDAEAIDGQFSDESFIQQEEALLNEVQTIETESELENTTQLQ